MSDTATAVEEREVRRASRSSVTAGTLTIKMVLVGLIDALLIWA